MVQLSRMNLSHEFSQKLRRAESFADIFSLVKRAVRIVFSRERSGLMLGLSELGVTNRGFVGAFYPVGSNLIVMNKTALSIIKENKPRFTKPYVFTVLMHEYLHTLGVLDEKYTEALTQFIISEIFGNDHPITSFVKNMRFYLPKLTYETPSRSHSHEIELVENFDTENLSYIG